jgi:hypothetical protein
MKGKITEREKKTWHLRKNRCSAGRQAEQQRLQYASTINPTRPVSKSTLDLVAKDNQISSFRRYS